MGVVTINKVIKIESVNLSDIASINNVEVAGLEAITAYYNDNSLALCVDGNWRSRPLYTPNGNNMATCYANDDSIYSDSAGTTFAASSHYKDTYSKPYTWYKWVTDEWTTTGTCTDK